VFGVQQAWGDVPLLAVVGLDAGGFFVEFDDGAVDGFAGGAGEADAVAEVEAGELDGALGLCEEFEPFDDLGVEETEVVFAEVLDGSQSFVAVQPDVHGFAVGHSRCMIRGGVADLVGAWRIVGFVRAACAGKATGFVVMDVDMEVVNVGVV